MRIQPQTGEILPGRACLVGIIPLGRIRRIIPSFQLDLTTCFHGIWSQGYRNNASIAKRIVPGTIDMVRWFAVIQTHGPRILA